MSAVNNFFALFLNVGVPLIGLVLALWGLLDVALRPASDFALAAQSKKFWLIALALSALVFACRLVPIGFYLPFNGLLNFAAFLAACFYLGPECQRMGPRGSRGGPRRNSGGW